MEMSVNSIRWFNCTILSLLVRVGVRVGVRVRW